MKCGNLNHRYWQWWILKTVLRHFLVVHWIGIHCQCRGHRFDPWSGKIPCGSEQQSLCAAAAEAQALRACSPQQEKSPQREALALPYPLLTATRESPGTRAKTQCSLKLKNKTKECWEGRKAGRVRMANKHQKRPKAWGIMQIQITVMR